ncbi:putative receptor protein kinase ZmPK1 [Vitis vinifera]|uniref:Receptor-like serine/threonine-protein kinase n=1 Tax=Vitis vinifera TaxID=29760 RepID=A0A438JAW2_VITVI|nr:putative receptor protein kinase ZmPK1 [Vitis vinifera]
MGNLSHASPKFPCILLTLLISYLFSFATCKTHNFLQRGSSLSVEDDSDYITSPDRSFTCGFYGAGGNAYWFSIWFTNSKERTVVWMANRDRPVNGRGSRISLRRDGIMNLRDADGSTVWETNTTSTDVDRAELLDTGNLVLKNPHGKILWQSFDFPTDTLLPNQILTRRTKLISIIRGGDFSSGYYILYFDNDNILRMMYDGPSISSLYWPNPDMGIFPNKRRNSNSSRIAVLDEIGRFLSSDNASFRASDMGLGVKRRLTIGYDGNLRLYSLNHSTGLWMISWMAFGERNRVHGLCGRNGICVYTPEPKCSCPPGYEVSDPSDWSKGCKSKFHRSCSRPQQVKFVELPHTDFYGSDVNHLTSVSLETCRKTCLEDCLCEAFAYRLTGNGLCFNKIALFNGFRSPNFPGTIYLKLPVDVETSASTLVNVSNPICESKEVEIVLSSPSMYDTANKGMRWVYLYSFASALGALEVLFIVSGWWFLFRVPKVTSPVEDGYGPISSQFRKFSYTELKKATNNFKVELGRGGFGAVYKGILEDERVVAVKKLRDVIQGEGEFWAEISTIRKIYHMNLVRMWGFCSEGRHRLLVYEHVENLSLDKHLFSTTFLGWKERFNVAVGTARGLAYLHHECLEWVIHCDVKPENILLDNGFEPKIADFGLAKLSQRGGPGSREFSRIRGTKEMVRGIRLSNWVMEDGKEQEAELTRFVKLVKEKIQCEEDNWIDDTVDRRLKGRFSRHQAATLIEIGISCVEEDRSKRPTMATVVQVLLECEDEAQVQIQELE